MHTFFCTFVTYTFQIFTFVNIAEPNNFTYIANNDLREYFALVIPMEQLSFTEKQAHCPSNNAIHSSSNHKTQ